MRLKESGPSELTDECGGATEGGIHTSPRKYAKALPKRHVKTLDAWGRVARRCAKGGRAQIAPRPAGIGPLKLEDVRLSRGATQPVRGESGGEGNTATPDRATVSWPSV